MPHQRWFANKAADPYSNDLYHIFRVDGARTFWLKDFVDNACISAKATMYMSGDICTGPTFMYWAATFAFILLLVNLVCLFAAAFQMWSYWFQSAKKKTRKSVAVLIGVGTVSALTAITTYWIGYINGGMHLVLSNLFFLTYNSRQTAPTLLGASFLGACLIFIGQTLLCGLMLKWPPIHPEEKLLEGDDDAYYTIFNADQRDEEVPFAPTIVNPPIVYTEPTPPVMYGQNVETMYGQNVFAQETTIGSGLPIIPPPSGSMW